MIAITNTIPAAQSNSSQPLQPSDDNQSSAKSGGKKEKKSGFSTKLAQAGAAAHAMTLPMSQRAALVMGGGGGMGAGPGRSVAGMNTAGSLAGLQPWDREWMRDEQELAPNPEMKPLLSYLLSQKGSKEVSKGRGGDKTVPNGLQATNARASAKAEALAKLEVLKELLSEAHAHPRVAQAPQAMLGSQSQSISPEQLRALIQAQALAHASANEASQHAAPVLHEGALAAGIKTDDVLQGHHRLEDRSQAGPTSLYGGLSGAEFLHALRGARNNGNSSQLQQEGGNPNPRSGLQVIDGGAKKLTTEKRHFDDAFLAGASGSLMGPHSHMHKDLAPPMTEVRGFVVQGSMARNRLSHEALLGMSGAIASFKPQGGGEMRVRLKPENLGELHVHVVTRGHDVGLRIQASDEGAKKVLEDSMSFLKESLASQNLNLARVDLSVAPPANHAGQGDLMSDGRQGQSAFQNPLGQNMGQGGRDSWGGSGRWTGAERQYDAPSSSSAASGLSARLAGPSYLRSARNDGRLDVRA